MPRSIMACMTLRRHATDLNPQYPASSEVPDGPSVPLPAACEHAGCMASCCDPDAVHPADMWHASEGMSACLEPDAAHSAGMRHAKSMLSKAANGSPPFHMCGSNRKHHARTVPPNPEHRCSSMGNRFSFTCHRDGMKHKSSFKSEDRHIAGESLGASDSSSSLSESDTSDQARRAALASLCFRRVSSSAVHSKLLCPFAPHS